MKRYDIVDMLTRYVVVVAHKRFGHLLKNDRIEIGRSGSAMGNIRRIFGKT